MTAPRLIAFCVAVVACYFASCVLIPLTLALFLAILLDPFVLKLEARGVPRRIGAVLVGSLFLALAGAGAWAVYRAIGRIMAELPNYVARVQELSARFEPSSYPSIRGWLPGSGTWTPLLMHGMGSLFTAVGIGVFVPLLLFAFLMDKPNLKESFNTITGKHFFIPAVDREVSRVMNAFVAGNLLGALALGLAQGAILHALGFGNAAALGLLSGFLNVIPVVGMPLALALPVAQGLLQFNDIYPFLVLGITWFGLHFVMGNVILPYTLGSRVNVNSVAILLGLLFWGWVWSGIGFLLAIPLTAVLKILLEANPETQALANLFAARPRHLRPRPTRRLPLVARGPVAVIRRLRPVAVPPAPAPGDPADPVPG